jgi:hypothetical protein
MTAALNPLGKIRIGLPPKPKFEIGDRVALRTGFRKGGAQNRGTVKHRHSGYDEDRDEYLYRVRRDDGKDETWPERAMHKTRARRHNPDIDLVNPVRR